MPPNFAKLTSRSGRFFLTQLHPILYLSLLLTPCLLAFLFAWTKYTEVQQLETQFLTASQKGAFALERKAKKELFRERYANANPYFLDEHLESMQFLQKEKSLLQHLLVHPAWPHKGAIQERLSWMQSDQNRLLFKEENMQTSNQVKETEEKLKHAVCLDEQDLQKVLCIIEDIPIGSFQPLAQSPQLLIRHFQIKRQKAPFQGEEFVLDLELFKREFLK